MANARFEKNPRIDADVELLLGHFRGLIPDGRRITHEDIEAILRIPRTQSRYKTVTNKWRRVLFDEQRVYLDGRSALGRGFIALTPDEMIRFSDKVVRQVGHMVKKAWAVANLPDPTELSSNEMRKTQALLLGAIEKISGSHKHVLLDFTKALRPPRQLPRAAS